MIRTTAKTFKIALATAALSMSALTVPAEAGSSISFSVAPASSQQERTMRTGLALYSLFNDVRSGGSIKQKGFGNSAGLAQHGSGNLGIVHQDGDGHSGTLTQNGSGNAHGLFQFGRNTNGHVVQNGDGGTGATFQFGW